MSIALVTCFATNGSGKFAVYCDYSQHDPHEAAIVAFTSYPEVSSVRIRE